MSLALHLSWSILWFWIHSFQALPTHFVVLGKASLSLSSCGHGMLNLLSRDCLSRWRQVGASRRKGAKDFRTLWGRSYDVFATQGAVQLVNHSVRKEVPTRTHWQRIISGVGPWLSTSFDIISYSFPCAVGRAGGCELLGSLLSAALISSKESWDHSCMILDLHGFWGSERRSEDLWGTRFTLLAISSGPVLQPPLLKVWKCSGKSGKGNGQKLPRESSAWPWGRLAREKEREEENSRSKGKRS